MRCSGVSYGDSYELRHSPYSKAPREELPTIRYDDAGRLTAFLGNLDYYIKQLRLVPQEFACHTGIPATAPVFLSPVVGIGQLCLRCFRNQHARENGDQPHWSLHNVLASIQRLDRSKPGMIARIATQAT